MLVADVEDIIRMKRAAARPKDLVEFEILTALRDEIDRWARHPSAEARSPRVPSVAPDLEPR